MKYIFTIGLVFIYILLNAQSDFRYGYLIKNNNDTLFGSIDYKGSTLSAKKCIFREDINSENQVFKPGQIKAYRYLDSKYYVSKFVDTGNEKEQLFLEFLINGTVDIYYYRDALGEHYFVDNANDNLHELKNEEKEVVKNDIQYFKETKEYIGVLKYTFRESPSIVKRVDNLSLNHKSLIKITNDYHDQICPDEECIVYEKKLTKTKHSFGFVIGLNGILISEMNVPDKFYYVKNSDFGFPIFPSIGIYFKWNLPFLNERLNFQYEGTYSYRKLQTSNSFIVEIHYKEYLNDITLTQNTFSNTALIKYEFPTGKIKPTFHFGGFVNYFFLTEYSRNIEIQSTLSGYTFAEGQFSDSPFSNWDYGISIGVGFKSTFRNKKELFLDLRYSRGFGLLEGLNTNTFLINLGYQLGK